MHKILKKEQLNSAIFRIIVEAKDVAARAKPGQFLVLRINEHGERIPLTICERDPSKGTVALIFQVVGVTTKKLSNLSEGDSILDILGPLGIPTEVKNFGKIACVGGGVGIAEVLPVTKAFSAAGNEVIAILGARTKELLILEGEIKRYAKEIHITTDDGTYGRKGFVTDVLAELLEKSKYNLVYAVGPIPMMRKVSEMTKPYGIKTIVSLNANMLDATGICATCRVMIAGKKKFACVHGPEFDGHEVDFDDLAIRANRFLAQEKEALVLFERRAG